MWKRKYRRKGRAKRSPLSNEEKGRFITRNVLLRKMGFKTYKAYLASPLWWKIRAKVWALAREEAGGGPPLCPYCEARTGVKGRVNRATQVHHLSYSEKVLTGKDLSMLVLICRACHKGIS